MSARLPAAARRALVAAALALCLAAVAPAAAPAASAHLSPTAYAALVRFTTASQAEPPKGADLHAYLDQLCGPAVDATADEQTRLLDERCRAYAALIGAVLGIGKCDTNSPSLNLACLPPALHDLAAATRHALAVDQLLGATLTGDCRGYFLDSREQGVALAKTSERLADSLDRLDAKRLPGDLKSWTKAYKRAFATNAAEERRGKRLMRACDPGVPAPAPAAPGSPGQQAAP